MRLPDGLESKILRIEEHVRDDSKGASFVSYKKNSELVEECAGALLNNLWSEKYKTTLEKKDLVWDKKGCQGDTPLLENGALIKQ